MNDGTMQRSTPISASRAGLLAGFGTDQGLVAVADLDGLGVPARSGRRLAHDVDQVADVTGAREEPVAQPTGALRRGPGVASDMDGDTAVGRLGVAADVGEGHELADVGGVVAGPERPEDLDVLVGAGAPPGEGDAEGVELLLQPAHTDAQLDPAARQVVEGGQLLGQDQRVAQGQDQDAGAEAQGLRGRGDKGQPQERIR